MTMIYSDTELNSLLGWVWRTRPRLRNSNLSELHRYTHATYPHSIFIHTVTHTCKHRTSTVLACSPATSVSPAIERFSTARLSLSLSPFITTVTFTELYHDYHTKQLLRHTIISSRLHCFLWTNLIQKKPQNKDPHVYMLYLQFYNTIRRSV
jgi:hypothetical protein